MGNCVCMGNQTTSLWSRDAWGSFSSKHKLRISAMEFEDDGEGLLAGDGSVTSSFPGVKREIKIRMTKKDLEDLMRRIRVKGLAAEEVISKLSMDGGDHLSPANQRSWRPALHSIPECVDGDDDD